VLSLATMRRPSSISSALMTSASGCTRRTRQSNHGRNWTGQSASNRMLLRCPVTPGSAPPGSSLPAVPNAARHRRRRRPLRTSPSGSSHHSGVPTIGHESTEFSSGNTCSCTLHQDTCWDANARAKPVSSVAALASWSAPVFVPGLISSLGIVHRPLAAVAPTTVDGLAGGQQPAAATAARLEHRRRATHWSPPFTRTGRSNSANRVRCSSVIGGACARTRSR
jgi:hypothetical protein